MSAQIWNQYYNANGIVVDVSNLMPPNSTVFTALTFVLEILLRDTLADRIFVPPDIHADQTRRASMGSRDGALKLPSFRRASYRT